MYFKRIDMVGFKSFADKTQLNLEPGISSVVGPNGCGKSNILDALRWALGEQSPKSLRGSHMQDVIFNGSEHRSPMGMAEVSLTFDNADSKLALDFAEVQVSRRVYRSGESEYLINNAPCRLKDVQELFMDTGIGTNAYSLIGQGKIAMVLSSKPEDRRFLFEEAAGIIKYKTRKRTALRKLETAEQNLLRLADIIAEVQRQMRSLKRQVNAAIRHREITDALRELEIRNAWLRHNELSGQISDLKAQFAESQDTYEKSSTQTSQQEAKLEELNLKRIELERVLMARRDGEHKLDSELEKLETQIALARKEIEFLLQQSEKAKTEHAEFLERAESLTQQQSDIDEKSQALRSEIATLQEELTQQQNLYTQTAQALADAEEAVEQFRTRSLETLSTRNQSQTELETIGVSLSTIDERLESILTRQRELSEQQDVLSKQLSEVKIHESEKSDALATVQKDRLGKTESLTEIQGTLQSLNDKWQNLREKKSSQEARLSSLRELRDSFEGFAIGVKAVMLAQQQNVLNVEGIIGPVGDLISTDKDYERAIEACLGGNINNVIVEAAESAKAAIAFLKETRAGRVTFLPLDTIRSGREDHYENVQGQKGVIGKAINYVQYEPRLTPAIEYLLHNTVIVETIDDAIRIARSGQRYPRLVTLDGEVVTTSGAVSGGRTKHDSRGILGRNAEIEELESAVASAGQDIANVTKEAQTHMVEKDSLQRELKALEEQESTLRNENNAIAVALSKLNTELESVMAATKELSAQREKLETDRSNLELRRESAQDKVKSIESDDATLQRETSEAQQKAAVIRQELAQLGDRLSDLRVKLAETSQTLQEAERNREREAREHAETLQAAERKLEQMGLFKEKVAEFEARIEDSIERGKALSENREEAHAKVVQAQNEQQALIESLDTLNDALKKLREKSNSAQKEVHRLELELSHKEDQLSFFQERILSEYNTALSSLKEEEVGSDDYDEDEREKLIEQHRKDLQRLGTVNLMAIDEYESLEKRHEFLTTQEEDLSKARETLLDVVKRIDDTIKEMFLTTFNQVAENFKDYFRRLFNGGQARIYLLDEDDPLETGIEIEARPPGKKPQSLSLLSGGEQAMSAIALLFSIFKAKPSPFCVLDEVDAPLDDANIGRFLDVVEEFANDSQFIIITHSKQTMARAAALFGVTQQELGVSQLVSVKFEDIQQ